VHYVVLLIIYHFVLLRKALASMTKLIEILNFPNEERNHINCNPLRVEFSICRTSFVR